MSSWIKTNKQNLWPQFKFPSGNYFFDCKMGKITQQNSKRYSLRERGRDIIIYSLTLHQIISLKPVKVIPSPSTVIGFRSEQKICWWFRRGVVGWAWVREDFHCRKQWSTVLSTSESLTELGTIGISGSSCGSFWFRWWGISPDNLHFLTHF